MGGKQPVQTVGILAVLRVGVGDVQPARFGLSFGGNRDIGVAQRVRPLDDRRHARFAVCRIGEMLAEVAPIYEFGLAAEQFFPK